MISKALMYCLEEENPFQLTDLFHIVKTEDDPQILKYQEFLHNPHQNLEQHQICRNDQGHQNNQVRIKNIIAINRPESQKPTKSHGSFSQISNYVRCSSIKSLLQQQYTANTQKTQENSRLLSFSYTTTQPTQQKSPYDQVWPSTILKKYYNYKITKRKLSQPQRPRSIQFTNKYRPADNVSFEEQIVPIDYQSSQYQKNNQSHVQRLNQHIRGNKFRQSETTGSFVYTDYRKGISIQDSTIYFE